MCRLSLLYGLAQILLNNISEPIDSECVARICRRTFIHRNVFARFLSLSAIEMGFIADIFNPNGLNVDEMS